MAKIFGQLETAQLENVTVDPANVCAGRIIYRTDLTLAKVSTGSGFVSLVDVSLAQTLTNKTLTSPILTTPTIAQFISNSITFTNPTADGTNGQILKTNGSGVLSFVTAGVDPLTTRGDINYRNASNVTDRLPVGAAGTFLRSDGTDPSWVALSLKNVRNYLLNSNFDFWGHGTSTTIANAGSAYQAEMWKVLNTLGTNGVITYSRVAAVTDGSKYGAKVQITTAPTALQANGLTIYQTIENIDALQLYNQSASFTIRILALNNVTQVGIQFVYNTGDALATTAIGSETLVTVNNATFTLGQISAQALGTSMTSSGTLGVKIRITAVSGGNIYDVNNGFVLEQAMVNLGIPSVYARAHPSLGAEHLAIARYWQKSWNEGIAIGTGPTEAGQANLMADGPNQVGGFTFRVKMRKAPTVIPYNPANGNINKIYYVFGGAEVTVNSFNGVGEGGVGSINTSATTVGTHTAHYVLDATF